MLAFIFILPQSKYDLSKRLRVPYILPIYKLISNTGPRHKPIFKIAVKLKNSKFISAEGKSKKDAQQKAAKLFLESIGK